LHLKRFKDKSVPIDLYLPEIGVSRMATTSIQASNLFNVDGLVAVITGGGSGTTFKRSEI
jgi:hypothetical protein